MIMRAAEFADGVLGENAARLAADESADPSENVAPKRRVERRVVDMADERRQRLVVTFGACRPSGYREPAGRRRGCHQIESSQGCSMSYVAMAARSGKRAHR